MIDYSNLWKTLALAHGQTLELDFGALQLQVHRGLQDWHLAHEAVKGNDEKLELRVHDAPFDADRDWTRWILDEKIDELRFQPQLPDRPIIVRPEMPICLMPKQSVQLFIGLPVWLSLIFGSRQEQAIEVPSMTLSNSWFGPFTEGELCYALKTPAKLRQHEIKQSAHRAVFALEIKNASSEKLKFERLCVRPQFLNIFQGESRLWTSKGRVSYRGEENWSRIIYASGPPGFDHAQKMVGRARDSMKRGSLLRTFDSLKQRVGNLMTESMYEWFSANKGTIIYCVLLLGLGIPLLRLVGYLIKKGLRKKISEQSIMLITKGVIYTGTTIIFLMVLQKCGVNLATLLGAAGIAGVALGFASQTSLANLISGLFLIGEKPFEVGDVLHAGTDHGVVHSVGLLSVQLRTFNNQLIRIPNETLIKSSFTNVTRFPIRRMDIPIGVAYKEDTEKVVRILKEIADANPFCLDEPEPLILFKGFGDSALEFMFGPWFSKTDYIALRNSLMTEIKKRFDAEGIEIPFPHRTLYAGEATKPFPVHVVPSPDVQSGAAHSL